MKKKALIVVNLAGFLHFLWNDIATLQEMGYEVSVAMNENSAAGPNLIEIPKLEEMGIAHYQVEFDTKSPVSTQNIQAYKQLKLILKTNKYDLIHCHTPIVGILTRMAARKYRKTGTIVIYTTHGFTFTDKSSKKNWIVYFTAEKLMSRFCDAIITINHEDYNNAKKMHCPKTYIIPSVGLDNHSIGEYLNSSFHAFTWTTDYVKDMEPLFPLLVLIVTKITGSLYCVQTILELCVILPLYVAVRKDKNTSLGMAIFVFCMAFYNPSMNMMRQSIAMSLGVLGFEYWKNAEKKNSFICVIIAFLFHTSSLLILLIYLLYDYIVKGTTLSITGNNVSKRNETPRMLISMGIGFVVMIMMSAIVSALSAVGFGEYVSYVTGKLVFMPNQLLIRIPQIILIIWSYRYLRKDGEDISFFLVMEVYAVLFSQFTSVSGYGGRIALYFAIFEVLVISQAMSALKPRKSGIIIRPLIIGYYMFYWWYYFVFVGAHQTVPYIFMR